jgi:poly(3-hydroxybutyrate) depolymerase
MSYWFWPQRMWAAFLAATLLAIYVTSVPGCESEPVSPLPPLGAKPDGISLSGISSGAYMAGQYQFAHGKDVAGAAIIAGGPYACAESIYADQIPGPGTTFLNISRAINGCMLNALMMFGIPDPRRLAEKAQRLAEAGRIDPLDTVISDRVYLFSGKEDRTVVPPIVIKAAELYSGLGVSRDRIKLVTSYPAGHAFVTEDSGLACDRSGKPFVVDCDYDQAGDLLSHIHGKLEPRGSAATGSYIVYDQRPFTRDLDDHGMADRGVVYVPRTCTEAAGCRLHVAFHGCAQNRATVGDAFVTGTGFARWADTNRFVILFPQTATLPINPQACWDWWGYTGRDYLTRDAPQIVAVHRMIQHLASARRVPQG